MRFIKFGAIVFGCACVFATLALGNESTTRTTSSTDFDVKLHAVLDKLSKDKDMAKWVDKELWNRIRHTTDRQVAEAIAKDEFVKSIRLEVDEILRKFGELWRADLRANSSQAMFKEGDKAGQYQGVLKAAQKIAKQFNFPKEVRSKLSAFVVQSSTVNAFAFPSLDTIDFALLTGLVELLNEPNDSANKVSEMVKKVIAHELAHVKAKHSEQRIIVMLVFLMKGKILIPAHAQDSWFEATREHVMRSLFKVDPKEALSSTSASMYRNLFDSTWDLLMEATERLSMRAEAEPEKFSALATKLGNTLSLEGYENLLKGENLSEADRLELEKLAKRFNIPVEIPTAEQAEGEAAKEAQVSSLTFGELIRFLLAMLKLSRSHEVTCDRFAQIATDKSAVQNTFSRLAGGRGSNPEAIMRQAEQWAVQLNKEPRLRTLLEVSTHPALAMRIHQADQFEKSPEIKILQNSIHKALALYLSGLKILEASEKALESGTRQTSTSSGYSSYSSSSGKGTEPFEMYLETEKGTPYKKMVEDIGRVVADAIIPDGAKHESEINTEIFAELIDHLQQAKKNNQLSQERLSTPGTSEKVEGLVFTLSYRLRHLEKGSLSDAALSLLKPFEPYGIEWKFNEKTGKLEQIRKTTNDTTQRELEDFKKENVKRVQTESGKEKAKETARRRR